MELITGHGGTNHVDAEDFGALNAGIFGSGMYVLSTGEKFAYVVNDDDNVITIKDGDGIINGRHFRIYSGETETVSVPNAAQGSYRKDIIGVLYTKNVANDNIETCEVSLISGREASSESSAALPAYSSGSILLGATSKFMPLYAVTMAGKNIASVQQLFTVMDSMAGFLTIIKDAVEEMKNSKVSILDAYPVGSIYMSVNDVNPGTIFGGTWVKWGSGRVPVGVKTEDPDLNAAEKTGGSKTLQKHTHAANATVTSAGDHTHSGIFAGSNEVKYASDMISKGSLSGVSANSTAKTELKTGKSGVHNHAVTVSVSETGTGDAGNMQPYITCYMYKRTA